MGRSRKVTLESLAVSVDGLTNGLDKLARSVAKGFANTATKDDLKEVETKLDKRLVRLEIGYINVNSRLESVENKVDHLNARAGHVETQIDSMNKKMVNIETKMIPRDEFDDLSSRVKYTEKKLNIKSGR
jgi:predicted  nucleic acid-binding Zn-ribbon protein